MRITRGATEEAETLLERAPADRRAKVLKHRIFLEGFAAKGVEVLLLTDAVDEFWLPSVGTYEGKAFKSATRGALDLDKVKADAKDEPKAEVLRFGRLEIDLGG